MNLSSRLTRLVHPNYQQDSQYLFWRNGLGLSVMKTPNDKVAIESGLTYLFASTKFSNLDDLRYTYNSNGEVTGTESVGTMELTERYNYLSLPILGHYYIFSKAENQVSLIGGVSFDWLMRRENHYNTTFDGEREDSFARGFHTDKVNTVIRIGLGLERTISEDLSLLLSLLVNHEFMSSIERRDDFQSFGMRLHLLYKR